jgi:hypothetical protein
MTSSVNGRGTFLVDGLTIDGPNATALKKIINSAMVM